MKDLDLSTESVLGDDHQNPITEDTHDGNSWCRDVLRPIRRYIPIMIQLKTLQTRILKMENYEKCWLHRSVYMDEEKNRFFSKTHSFRETRSRSNTEKRSKCTTYSS